MITLSVILLSAVCYRPSVDELDRVLDKVAVEAFEAQYPQSRDERLIRAVDETFTLVLEAARACKELPRTERKLRVTVIESGDANAYSLPDGSIYLTTALAGLPGTNRHEVAFALAHEVSHVLRGHGRAELRRRLATELLNGIAQTRRDKVFFELGALLFRSGYQRSEERQADRDAWQILGQSQFRQSAPLALLRRIEKLQPKETTTFAQLFATHPAPSERTRLLKDWLIAREFSWNFFVGRAQAAQEILGEYDNTDPVWRTEYERSTGWKVHHLPNYFSNRYQGECTWFAQAVRPDELPLNPRGGNNAVTLPERCVAAGYAIGNTPKPGALAIWNSTVGNGAGHVALIAETLPDGKLRVWDSNWGKEASDTIYTNGRVRHRIMKPDSRITAYIYWPNGQQEAPQNYPSYQRPPERIIRLIDGPFIIGDEDERAEMIRLHWFQLSDSERQQSASLELDVRALPGKDPIISLNRVEIGRVIANSADWKQYRFTVPVGLLRQHNLLDIEALLPSMDESYDDCEIRNVVLRLQ